VLVLLTATVLTRAQAPVAVAERTEAAKAEALTLDKKIIDQVKADSEIMANLTYLSDVIGPRLTGSANLKRANEWTAEKMRSYGLSNVHLEPWTIPVGWERGTAYARLIEPDNGRTLMLASAGWSPSTKGKIEGDVVVLRARTAQELAPYKGKLKNAIVLQSPPQNVPVLGGQRGQGGRRGGAPPAGSPGAPAPGTPGAPPSGERGTPTPATPGGERGTPAPGTPGQPPDGFRRGGGGFGPSSEVMDFLRAEGVACLLRDSGKPQGLLNMTGSWRGQDRVSGAEPIPSAFMAHEYYAMLYRLASRPAPARTRVELELTNKIIPGPVTVYNTVGEIPGSEKPDEVVICGAHLDSWDLGTGTTDNGTGTCVVLETARAIMRSGIKPKRTIRFCLFTGEEEGLHGSRAYVQQHKDELPKISLCLVHDTGTGKVTGIGTQGRTSVKPILDEQLVALKDLGLQEINTRGMGGSDHQSFEAAGVPGFALQQDMSEYNWTHHTQSDTLDKVHEADLIEGAQVMAVAAMRVANLPNLLPRDKPPGAGGRSGRGGRGQAEPPALQPAPAKPGPDKPATPPAKP
jgi:hypothetical protein